jgi:zinc transport system substrate-binding protein
MATVPINSYAVGMRSRLLLPLSLAAALALSACGADAPADTAGDATADPAEEAAQTEVEPLDVVVALFPYQYVVERVGGDAVEVVNVTPPGVDPHDLELSPRQVAAVGEADLVVYSRGFTPALDAAVDQQAPERAVDALQLVEVRPYDAEEVGEADDGHGHSRGHADEEEEGHADEGAEHGEEGHEHEGEDPHVWLDPERLTTIATTVADELAALAPEAADDFRDRAEDLAADLAALDQEFRDGLATCERRDVVVSHDAFGYLTERYDLNQIAVSLSPEDEPSPRRLAEVARAARERGVTTIFFEETVSPRVAEQLARELGAEPEVLSPLEAPPETGDYLSAMRDNLAALRSALSCT